MSLPSGSNSQVTTIPMTMNNTPTELSRSVSPEPTLNNSDGIQLERRRLFTSVSNLWREEVVSDATSFQMSGAFIMSGYMNAISFSAIFVWCGFQSGNTAQLAVAMARLWEGGPDAGQFLLADQQALASLLSFVAGILLGRLGQVLGPKTRGWMWLSTIGQALLTMLAAITSWKSGEGYPGISNQRYDVDPVWSDHVSFMTIILMSMSMGMQGITNIALKTPSSATLPLTTTWVEIFTMKGVFKLNELNRGRDQRVIGVVSVLLGALAGRGFTFLLGSPGSLGIGAAIRVVIAFSWIFVPGIRPPSSYSNDGEKSQERRIEQV